ncbi:hypothetical protein Sango_0896200 [Sesamum angolense]|uniref:UTP23 sensor motif region domain-containing protein n=1 Tax=Sesamum angolense TaxID=2727404 RepID=A0AAE2BXX1_9LAMI|nr:hypothetical protein Sango_0896200 [Sesamum angolense]
MRVKKQKRHRRAVRFYTACFGFREPFKILCDGTFVHHLLANRITPADTALANTLGAPVKIFTTRCVLAELRSLGDSYSDSLNAARNLIAARCDHEKRKSAVACIMDVIGGKNPEHFFVATQDAELRRSSKRNALFLERPSTFQHEFAKTAEEERSHMTDLEYKMLKVKKKRVSTEEARDSSDANEGPNPLSCKKKKSEGNTNAASREGGNVDNNTRSRSRKRKRSRKSKSTTESNV